MRKWIVGIIFTFFVIQPYSTLSEERDAGQDLTIDSEYIIVSSETWDNVYVEKMGTLKINSGGILNAKSIILNGGALEINGGEISLSDNTSGNDVLLSGNVTYFRMNGGKITLTAPNGGNIREKSHGGDAIVSIYASQQITITNGSVIRCTGGDGKSITKPWTSSEISGRESAGGNGVISLGGPETPNITIENNVNLFAYGGNGGKAADGEDGKENIGGKGGGYSNGGRVSGYVGAGGSAKFIFESSVIIMKKINIEGKGGKGGDAGNGGDGCNANTYYLGGGGGGGYAGGDGGDYAQSGSSASVSGFVGSGGEVRISIKCTELTMEDCTFKMNGGDGGNAGNGGKGGRSSSYWRSPGGGGGGYAGGGGGGSYYGNGGGGSVGGNVGAGGETNISISAVNALFEKLTVICTGGNGGKGGRGGDGNYGGGGGAGYAGGGGGGSYSGGGSGRVSDNVGMGGNSTIIVSANSVTFLNSTITLTGGNGGNAGNGGNGGGGGGGGGGGYGGGGGAGYYPWSASGGSGSVGMNVGRGGFSIMRLLCTKSLFMNSSQITLTGGVGGNAGNGGSGSGGGGGGGGYGGGGGSGAYVNSPGQSTVMEKTGDGGDAEFYISAPDAFIPADFIKLNVAGGKGGIGKSSPGGGSGGKGTGRVTKSGTVIKNIPRLIPVPTHPPSGSFFNKNPPTLVWIRQMDGYVASENRPDPILSYGLQIDNNPDFTSPEIDISDIDPSLDRFTPSNLEGGIHYWRVCAIYSEMRKTKWSDARNFTLNGPPKLVKNIPDIKIHEDTNRTSVLNLDDYFEDDVYKNLTYSVSYEQDRTRVHIEINGTYIDVYTVMRNWYGTKKFRVMATDAGELSIESNEFSINVLPVNDPPVILPIPPIEVTEDKPLSIDFSEYLEDVDNPLNQLKIEVDSQYATVNGLNVTFLYPYDIEKERVNITVSDGSAKIKSWFDVIVIGVNDAPEILNIPLITIFEDSPSDIDLIPFGRDEEDSSMELIWSATTESEIFDVDVFDNHILKIIPKDNLSGEGNIDIEVKDSDGKTASTTVYVRVVSVNDPPVIKSLPELNITVGKKYKFDMKDYISDVDNDYSDLTLTAETPYAEVSGFKIVFLYPIDESLDTEDVKITVSDGKDSSSTYIRITLRFPPLFINKMEDIQVGVGKTVEIDLKEYANDREDSVEILKWIANDVNKALIDVYIDEYNIMTIKGKKKGVDDIILTVMDSEGNQNSMNVTVYVMETEKEGGWDTHGGESIMFVGGIIGIVIVCIGAVFAFRKMIKKRDYGRKEDVVQQSQQVESDDKQQMKEMSSHEYQEYSYDQDYYAQTSYVDRTCFACGFSPLYYGYDGNIYCSRCGRKQFE